MSQKGKPNFSLPEEEIGLAKKRIGQMVQYKRTLDNNIQTYEEHIKELLVTSFRDLFRGMKGVSCEDLTDRIFWIVRFLVTKYPKTRIKLQSLKNDSNHTNVMSNTGLLHGYRDKSSPNSFIAPSDGRVILNEVICGKKPELTEEAKKFLTAELKKNNPSLEMLRAAFEDIDSVCLEVSCGDIL